MRLMSLKVAERGGGIVNSSRGSNSFLLTKSALPLPKDDDRFIQEGARGKGWKGM